MPENSYVAGPSAPAVLDKTLGQLLKEAAVECPQRIALIDGAGDGGNAGEVSYAQLYADAELCARALLRHFSPGERVAVMAPNIPQWVVLEFGTALAGLVLVTLNPAYQPAEIEYVLKQSRSAGIFVLPEFRGNPMQASVQSVASNCPELREVISIDEWDTFLRAGQDQTLQLPDVQPGDATMIQYTSGTTGFPKGVLLHHRGLVNNASHFVHNCEVAEGSTSIVMVPLFHTSGCVLGILSGVAMKNTQVLLPAFEPGRALELIETYQVNSFGGVPTMMIAMLEHPDFQTRDLSSLRRLTSGGSTVPAALVRRLEQELGVKMTIVFGQTECSPVASMTLPGDSIEDKAGTIGGPMPNVEVKIVDIDSGDIAPLNSLGEYCTRGYHVMQGYFDMPEETAAAIDADGWLHTGDLCSMDERGYCKVEGRLKDMIIRGGENIYPREIENLLFKHDSVGEVAVVGLPDERMGEIVAAFIRPAPDRVVDKDALFAWLREHLSPQKTPTSWFIVDQFPLTGSGKIQKFELAREWQAGKHTAI